MAIIYIGPQIFFKKYLQFIQQFTTDVRQQYSAEFTNISFPAQASVLLFAYQSTSNWTRDLEKLIGKHPELPFIVVDSQFRRELGMWIVRSGIKDYIVLPQEANHLKAVLDDLLKAKSRNKIQLTTGVFSRITENNRIEQAKLIIDNRFTDQLSIRQIANCCHLSTSCLNRGFKRTYGISINKYIVKLRMLFAMHLLKSSPFTVTQIAMKSGYNDTSYFIRSFKRHFGVTPANTRKNTSEAAAETLPFIQ